MLATFIIEIILALWVLRRRQGNMWLLAFATLVLLATFQLAEYNVCAGRGGSAEFWSRLGYVAITMLPPLGVHIVTKIGKHGRAWPAILSYGVGVPLAGYFALVPSSVIASVCQGNYVIFDLHGLDGFLYGAYYYAVVYLAIILALMQAAREKVVSHRRALYWMTFGILAFLVPTSIVNAIDPRTFAGIPSIMCGFAVMFALVLALKVVPLASKLK